MTLHQRAVASDGVDDGEQVGAAGAEAGTMSVPRAVHGGRMRGAIAKYGLLGVLALAVLIFSLARPDSFFNVANLTSILQSAAVPALLASGLTVVLVMQDFDLSVGSMISLSGGLSVVMMSVHGVAWPIAILVSLALGAVVGAVSGFIVAYLKGPSFVITLAMGTLLTGAEYAVTNLTTIFTGVEPGYLVIGQESTFGLNNQVWIAVIIAAIIWILLDATELGRYMYAIGGNSEAARLSGINTKRLRLIGFIVVGVCAAICGVLLTAQSGSYSPNFGASYMLPAFTAAFLGSAVLRPGEFSIPGTLIGVVLLQVIQTGLIMLNLATSTIFFVQGAILIIAVLASVAERRR